MATATNAAGRIAVPDRILSDEIKLALELLATSMMHKLHHGGLPLWRSRKFRVFIARRYSSPELHYSAGGL